MTLEIKGNDSKLALRRKNGKKRKRIGRAKVVEKEESTRVWGKQNERGGERGGKARNQVVSGEDHKIGHA